MENIRDWCISRQLWWGHRIPAFFCDDCGEMVVTGEDSAVCPKCGKEMRQDPDTLDTWFSSALWPFSTLGWPDKTPELDYFYPTDTLVTGYDIITFWVSRMIFSGLEWMGERPFKNVLIHGLVRDAQGRKMSKSLGNGIDPLEIIDKYGADSLRFALATGNSPGNDMRFSDEKIEAGRNFANKLWNASRFVLMNLTVEDDKLPETLLAEDKWILSRFRTVAAEVTENLDRYEIGIAAAKVYDFLWDEFCDWYIEFTKGRLSDKESEGCENAQRVLVHVLCGTLKLLHPFMPFITEEIWQALPHEGESIMICEWPDAEKMPAYPEEEAAIAKVMAAIRAVRNRRAEMNVPPSRKAALTIVCDDVKAFTDGAAFFEKMASANGVTVTSEMPADTEGMVSVITHDARLLIPMAELVDTEKEIARLEKELANAENEIRKAEAKLANEGFVAKAPAAVVEGEKAKIVKFGETVARIRESIASLKK